MKAPVVKRRFGVSKLGARQRAAFRRLARVAGGAERAPLGRRLPIGINVAGAAPHLAILPTILKATRHECRFATIAHRPDDKRRQCRRAHTSLAEQLSRSRRYVNGHSAIAANRALAGDAASMLLTDKYAPGRRKWNIAHPLRRVSHAPVGEKRSDFFSDHMSKTLHLLRRMSPLFGITFHRPSIDLRRAAVQHRNVIDAVIGAAQRIGGGAGTLVLPASHEHADSCFVGDCCVPLRPRLALLANPADAERRGELDALENFFATRALQSEGDDGCCWRVLELSSRERCNGGDLLRIGNTLFIGRNRRTNAAALRRLFSICAANALLPVVVPTGAAPNLKSLVTWLGPDVGLVAVNSTDGLAALRCMFEHLPNVGPSKVHLVGRPLGINMLRIGDTVLYQPETDICPLMYRHRHLDFKECDVGELFKAGGTLSCCVVTLE